MLQHKVDAADYQENRPDFIHPEIEIQAELMDSPDTREALQSFFEKRAAQYTGD